MSEAYVTVRRGSLYIGRDLYERFFAGTEAIVLLRRGDDLLILPVRHAAAGGYLLKQRNGAGDRVVNASDFFRQFFADDAELDLPVRWIASTETLVATDAFSANNVCSSQNN